VRSRGRAQAAYHEIRKHFLRSRVNAADELQSNAGHNSDSDSVASSKQVQKRRAQKKHRHSRELKELGDFKCAVLIEDAIHRDKEGRHRYFSVNTPWLS